MDGVLIREIREADVPRSPGRLPGWLAQLAEAVRGEALGNLIPSTHRLDPVPGARPAAVLMLFGDGPDGPDVLVIERAADLRAHAGQPAFPGGATDPTDSSPAETAMREAYEEVGIDPACVAVLTCAHPIYLPPSNFLVTPVLAWWHTPCPVAPVDAAETSSVARVPLRELADPNNRLLLRHPQSGYVGAAFRVRGMLVWGFTAALLDAMLRLGGWERPWARHQAAAGAADEPPGGPAGRPGADPVRGPEV